MSGVPLRSTGVTTPGPVAVFHNAYTVPGGEDISTQTEIDLLRASGARVVPFLVSNEDVVRSGRIPTLAALWRSSFNRSVYRRVRSFCREHKPTVAHVQNFWFALSPSVHAACHDEGVPTVQSLRNYRLLCVNAFLLRNDRPCEDCVGRIPWRGVARRCYEGSAGRSLAVARMIQRNRWRGTWDRDVDVFIALTEFSRQRFIRGGLPAERIVIKPNTFAGSEEPSPPGEGAVFVGRLSPEKGIGVLISAWRLLPDVSLAIVGSGPLQGEAATWLAAARPHRIHMLGHCKPADCIAVMRRSAFLVMASQWYEGFPRVIVEAYALGRPVVAPRLGSMAELVDDGETGLLFEPGDASDLAQKVAWIAARPDTCAQMGRAARRAYEERYSAEKNVAALLSIYERARVNFDRNPPLRTELDR